MTSPGLPWAGPGDLTTRYSLRHRRLRMTGTEQHAPRGTAGCGPDWDRGHFLLSSFGPHSARLHCDPKNGLAAGGAAMRMRRRVAPAARARPMIPVQRQLQPTAGGAASYSAVQLRRSPRAAHGPCWARSRRYPAELPEHWHAARSPASVPVIRRRTGVMAYQVGSPVLPMVAPN